MQKKKKNLLNLLHGSLRGHSHSFKDIVLIHSVTLPFSSTLIKKKLKLKLLRICSSKFGM